MDINLNLIMKKTLIALFIVLTSLASAQTQLDLPQLNAIWNTPSVPKGLNNTNTWYSLLQTLSINSTSLTISGGNSVNLSFITSGASITGTLSVGSVPYAVGTRTLTNGPLYTNGTNVGLGTTTLTSTFNLNGSFMYVDGNQSAGKILVSDANGVGAWTTNSVTSGGSSVYNGTNTVGYMPYVKARNAAGTSYTLAPSPLFSNATQVAIGSQTVTTGTLFQITGASALAIRDGSECYGCVLGSQAHGEANWTNALKFASGATSIDWFSGTIYESDGGAPSVLAQSYDLSVGINSRINWNTLLMRDQLVANSIDGENRYLYPSGFFGEWSTDTPVQGAGGNGNAIITASYLATALSTFTVPTSSSFTIALTGAGINTITKGAGNDYTVTATEAQTLSLNSANALMISGTSSTVQITTGYAYVGVPSSAMVGKVIAGASGYVESYTTNANVFEGYAFITTATTSVQFLWQAPDGWDMGTVKFKFSWTTISTTVTGTAGVAWEVSGVAIGDAAALDVSTGTKVIITDTNNGKDQNNITSATAAVTISGTPAIGKFVLFTVTRQINDAADNLTADAKLLSAQIQYLQANTPTTIW